MAGSGKDAAWSVSLPKRVTTQNYDENAYRNALHGKAFKDKVFAAVCPCPVHWFRTHDCSCRRQGAPKPPKQLQVCDFQFFDVARLEELRAQELRHFAHKREVWHRRCALCLLCNECRRRALVSATFRVVRYIPDGSSTSEELTEAGKRAPPPTEEDIKEKAALMKQGFGSWTRKDLMAFVRSLEVHGRDDLTSVAADVDGKPKREVARYAVTFFKRCREVKECERLLRRIHQGEAQLAKRAKMIDAIAKKVGSASNPFIGLSIDYAAGGASNRDAAESPFTEENDRHLVCLANQIGYGRWELLMHKVRRSLLFRFDYYVKTRTAVELGQRVEVLGRLIERQVADSKTVAEETARKAKRLGGKAVGQKSAAVRSAADDHTNKGKRTKT